MNNVVSDSIGLDAVISRIQTDLFAKLTEVWGSIDMYGRAYRNQTAGGEKLEWYTGEGESQDVYYNDNVKGTVFFLDQENHSTQDEMVFQTDVKVIAMLNLEDIYGNTTRKDSEAQRTMVEALREINYENFTIDGISKGVDAVFSGESKEGLKYLDMYPKHCFSVNVTLTYYLTDNC
jgi:hypothetical protein